MKHYTIVIHKKKLKEFTWNLAMGLFGGAFSIGMLMAILYSPEW